MQINWYSIPPLAKPRQSQRDKWMRRGCVIKYRAYADEVRRRIEPAVLYGLPSVIFVLPFPASKTSRFKLDNAGKPHENKPDLDNLIKGLMDALLPGSDSLVHSLSAVKVWGYHGCIGIGQDLAPSSLLDAVKALKTNEQ